VNTKELDTKIGKGVRNVTLSEIAPKGLAYDIDTGEKDEHGTLHPESHHCWLRWESRIVDPADGTERWVKESAQYDSIAEAQEAEAYIRKHVGTNADA
jgi:hypothetical protein